MNNMLRQKPPSKIEITVSRLRDGGYAVRWQTISLSTFFKPYHRQAVSTHEEMLNRVDQILAIL
jgi:hypothetical protein